MTLIRSSASGHILQRALKFTLLRRSKTSSSFATANMVAYPIPTGERLAKLRELMKKKENDVTAYIIPSEDQHGSEYSADCDERRAFISGFDGSAGLAIVTLKDAFMFTDGRYFLQAGQQLDNNWTLMKQGLPDVPTWQEFLSNNLQEKSRIGLDPTLITFDDSTALSKSLKPRNSSLVSISQNLVDEVWSTERPLRPGNSVVHLEEKFSGESHTSKLHRVKANITDPSTSKADYPGAKPLIGASSIRKVLVLSALDEIAWLFNLRGSDIAYNPVFFAYAVVHLDDTKPRAVLFAQKEAVGDSLGDTLGTEVEIRAYDEIWTYLKSLGEKLRKEVEGKSDDDKKVILLSDKSSLAVAETIGEDIVMTTPSPVAALKAIKNSVELNGFRQSHIRDGAALARYFAWLEEALANGKVLTEWQGAEKLEEFRSQLDHFKGLSFPTISSIGPNGAIIHYSPSPTDSAVIKQEQVYLCDSGAQFEDGTTDVTRTWHFGQPTDEEKRAATRVLQGHIAIDTAIFPNGTTGFVIDSWARRALWQDGLDYRHGTGHGVGHFLNVHEGPQGIGTRIAYNSTALRAGMTVSNEPGYYADGKFGVRIENIVLVRKAETPNNFGEKGYLSFEHVTMCPIQTKLVDTKLLTAEELQWLNDYHKEVWEKVSPLLTNDERALNWLKKECQALFK
ncbi:Creatinase/aminopeptidase [Marasmius fiardii PR-910]|nr:Creatinase/aminopeptidase [Marasmius fiardii PR-910]